MELRLLETTDVPVLGIKSKKSSKPLCLLHGGFFFTIIIVCDIFTYEMKRKMFITSVGAFFGSLPFFAKADADSGISSNPQDIRKPYPLGITQKDIDGITIDGTVIHTLLAELIFCKLAEKSGSQIESVLLTELRYVRPSWRDHSWIRYSFALPSREKSFMYMDLLKPKGNFVVEKTSAAKFEANLAHGKIPLQETCLRETIHQSGFVFTRSYDSDSTRFSESRSKRSFSSEVEIKGLHFEFDILPAESFEFMGVLMQLYGLFKNQKNTNETQSLV